MFEGTPVQTSGTSSPVGVAPPQPPQERILDDRFGEETSPRHSGLKIEVTVSVGYTRQRAGLEVSDKWETSITTILLLVFGAALIIWFVVTIVNHLISILPVGQ